MRLVMNKKYLVIKCTAYIYLLNTLPEETGRTVSRKDIYITRGNRVQSTTLKGRPRRGQGTYGRHIPQTRTRVVNIRHFTPFHYLLMEPELYFNIVRTFTVRKYQLENYSLTKQNQLIFKYIKISFRYDVAFFLLHYFLFMKLKRKKYRSLNQLG